jgi:hypothetical protein
LHALKHALSESIAQQQHATHSPALRAPTPRERRALPKFNPLAEARLKPSPPPSASLPPNAPAQQPSAVAQRDVAPAFHTPMRPSPPSSARPACHAPLGCGSRAAAPPGAALPPSARPTCPEPPGGGSLGKSSQRLRSLVADASGAAGVMAEANGGGVHHLP